jgi:hypothetical protein
MRVLLIVAFVLAIIAAIAFAVPTAVLGLSGMFWLATAFVFYFLDLLVGGWAVPVNTTRSGPIA